MEQSVSKRSALGLSMLIGFALPAGCAPESTEGASQSYSCEIPEGDTGGSGDVAVEVRDGEVRSLSVQTYFPGLPGNPGYSCTLRAARGDGESSWTVEGAVTTVELTAEKGAWPDPDLVRIVPLPGGYRIDLSNTRSSSMTCGAGAELPEAITIVGTGGQCRTDWGE